jgi:hypothetical protein
MKSSKSVNVYRKFGFKMAVNSVRRSTGHYPKFRGMNGFLINMGKGELSKLVISPPRKQTGT